MCPRDISLEVMRVFTWLAGSSSSSLKEISLDRSLTRTRALCLCHVWSPAPPFTESGDVIPSPLRFRQFLFHNAPAITLQLAVLFEYECRCLRKEWQSLWWWECGYTSSNSEAVVSHNPKGGPLRVYTHICSLLPCNI